MEPNSDDANLDYRDVLRLKATRHSTFFRHLSSMNWHSSSSESHQSSSSTAMTSADVVIPMNSHTIPSAGESHTVLRQTLSQKWRQKFTNGLSYAPDTADRPEPTLSIGNPNRSDVLPCTDSAEDHHISSENVNELMELNKQRDGSTNKIAAQTFNHQPLRHPHRAATIVPADFDSDSCECGDCGRFCCYGNSVSKYNKYQATDKSEAERETRKAISRDVTVNGNSSVLCCNCSHGRFFHTDNNNYCCTDIQFQQSSTASRTDANHSEQLVESTARLPPECDCCRGPDTCHTTSADVRNNARVASHRCDDALTAVVAAHQQPKQYTVETSSIFLRQRKQVVYSRDALKKAQKIQCDNLCGDARVRVNTAAAAASASAAFSFPCVKKSVKSYLAMIEKKSNELRMQSSGQSTTTSASTKVTVNCDNKNSGDSCSSSAALTNNLRQTNFECISVTPPPPPPPSPSGEHPHPQSPNSPQLDSLERVDFTRSPSSDEGCHPNRSPFFSSSSDEDDGGKSSKEKVARSPSSDSALGLDDEIVHNADDVMMMPPPPPSSKRRMTLTVSDILVRTPLLPLIDPCNLPQFKCTDNVVNTGNLQIPNQLAKPNIPSKTILEARIIEIPPTIVPTTASAAAAAAAAAAADNAADPPNSRRESAQSCISEGGGEIRYMRTPSVVVSDYSDDVMCGITLEEIEYFRKQRMRRGSLQDCDRYESDISAASSCSNLNYCGSTISYLDMTEWYPSGNLAAPSERKVSNCSSCSTLSGDEEDSVVDMVQSVRTKTLPKKPSGWRKLRNIVQWTPFFQTYKRQRYPWVQLAGHQGNFKAGPDQGTVLKKLCPKEELCFKVLMKDVLRPYVPEYKGQVTSEDGEVYLQLQDLLGDFNEPCVMDCKIGVRTYLEEELSKAKEKPKLRKDMYEKMIQIDPEAPNDEEHRAKGVTKPRYMIWRETISSTATLGFRIEGIKKGDGSSKDFKTTKSRDQILAAFKDFTETLSHSVAKYIQRLKAIRATLECSEFFRRHEVIGSSLLFVHDKTQASIWLIDFAKTVVLPEATAITHSSEWSVGNHEDGYLIGINNLISIFEEVQAMRSAARNTYLEENLPKLSLNCEEQILNNNNEMEVMPSVKINCSGPGGTE